MTEVLDFLNLFGGFVYLLMGGDLLVRGAIGLARQSKISPMVIGLTVVAMGTSAPELMVSSFSALSGYPSIALGNIVGSNICNILFVIGGPVLAHPIACSQKGLIRQTGLMVCVSALLIAICWPGTITFADGLLLLAILAVFLVLTMRKAGVVPKQQGQEAAQEAVGSGEAEEELEKVLGMPGTKFYIVLFIVLGIVALPIGADLAVKGAAGLAASWGVSQAVIGLSLVAIGTSLPEFSTNVLAAIHKSSEVAIGNVVGSNLFNILGILGITALLTNIPVDPHFLHFDLWVMLFSAMLLMVYVLRKATIGRTSGIFFLAAYVAYMYAIYRG